MKVLIAKPGLDGHDVGAKVVCRALRDAGFDVVYTGLRQSPEAIASAALHEGVDAVGLSILSGSHAVLVVDVLEGLKKEGLADIPVVAGGIIPDDDAKQLVAAGVVRVYTPKDFDLTHILDDIVDVASEANARA